MENKTCVNTGALLVNRCNCGVKRSGACRGTVCPLASEGGDKTIQKIEPTTLGDEQTCSEEGCEGNPAGDGHHNGGVGLQMHQPNKPQRGERYLSDEFET